MKYFCSFWHYISILYLIFLTEAAQYECSYRRTAHHATGSGISGLQSGLWTSLYGTQVVTILVHSGVESTTRRMQIITGRAGQLHALYVELVDIVFEVALMSSSSRPTCSSTRQCRLQLWVSCTVVRRCCDCTASSTPTTNVQTRLDAEA